jgi:hypothetical protein
MFLFLALVVFSIFLALALLSGILVNNGIDSRICKVLKQHNCTPISIRKTSKIFTPDKQQTNQSWKKFVFMGPSPAETTFYKEVVFNTPANQTITSLVAIDSFLLLFRKIYFQVDLNTVTKSS